MGKSAIIYNNPFFYSIGIKLLHLNGFRKIKKIVGKGKKVFEPACGYGRLRGYLHRSCKYSGIDLNKKFIEFGRKKGLDIKMGNVLEEKNYEKSDIVILCDILHHLSVENINKLVSISRKFAKEKLVIMEPAFVGVASGKNIFSKLMAKLFVWVDNDGINKRYSWLSRKEYNKLFQEIKEKYKFAQMKIQIFKQYYFVEFVPADTSSL